MDDIDDLLAGPDDFLLDDVLGTDPEDPLETSNIPTARALRRQAKARMARIRQRQALTDAINQPPRPGETLHVIADGTFDFATWIPLILDQWLPKTDTLYCSTWTLSAPVVTDLLQLWDQRKIGQVGFLTGRYFKRRESAVYARLLSAIRDRGGKYRALPNHAKIVLFNHGGTFYTITGSANLTGNPRAENYTWVNGRDVWRFHRDWFEETLRTIPPEAEIRESTPKPTSTGKHQRRARLGVYSVHSGARARTRVFAWKEEQDQETANQFAGELVELIREAVPVPPPGTVITTPPQGASWPGPYAARALAAAVADLLGLPHVEMLERTDTKPHHHPMAAIRQAEFTVARAAPAAIVVDDAITSGTTMRLALDALRAAGVTAWGFTYAGAK